MQEHVLFPVHEDLTPDPARTEPSVWIRRFSILSDQDDAVTLHHCALCDSVF